MAFLKRSVAVTTPKPAHTPNALSPAVSVGEERDGMVWDGTTWVPKPVWEARHKEK
jgi:hypothetical protein